MASRLLFRRAGAYLLDIGLLFAVLAPAGLTAQLLLGMRPQTGLEVWTTLLWNFSLPTWVYFAVADGSPGGVTVGKWLLGVRVRFAGGRVPWTGAVLRTAVKLLPWELTHVSAFALAGDPAEFRSVQFAGLGAANLLAIVYLGTAALTGGRRSVHDFIARTVVCQSDAEPGAARGNFA